MKKLIFGIALFGTISSATAQVSTVFDGFDFNKGQHPQMGVVYDGTYLYGATQGGGVGYHGNIYKVKPDGTGFDTIRSGYVSSILINGGYLYATSGGNILKLKPDGTEVNTIWTPPTNWGPLKQLTTDGTWFYVPTNFTFENYLIRIKMDGSSFDTLYTSAYNANHYQKLSPVYFDGTFLYGTTDIRDNSALYGSIYKIKTDGTGYEVIHEFDDADGGWPHDCKLISDGTYLYGVSENGNAQSKGFIYRIKKDGSDYMVLHTFSGADGIVSGIGNYVSGLVLVGEYLFGATHTGGASSSGGVIYKIKKDGSDFTLLHNPTENMSPVYSAPNGPFVSDGTYLYGTAQFGATDVYSGDGSVFKINAPGQASGIESLEQSAISIYPNPASNVVALNNISKGTHIRIIDITGNELYKTIATHTNVIINTEGWSNGTYIIKGVNKENTFSKKLLINR